MCYEAQARPPLPPVSGGAADGRRITLRSADGTSFAAYAASAEARGGPGIVVLPDVRGLHAFYSELALRFAAAGLHAVAIDYFGRTAGTESRDDDFDFMTHVAKTQPEQIAADVAAAIAHLRSDGTTRIFTIGFCFGGRSSFNQAADQEGLAGVIGFYGRVARRDDLDANAPLDRVPRYRSPVLGLFGGADPAIPAADVDAFRAALDAAGIRNEIVSYEGAPHSFFDRASREYGAECDDAWERILRFVRA